MSDFSIPEETSGEIFDIDKLQSPDIARAVAHWRLIKGSRQFPSRDEIVLKEIASSLKHTMLVKILDEGADYEFRVVGDVFVQGFSENFTGKRLSRLAVDAPKFGFGLRILYETVRTGGSPLGYRCWVGRDMNGAEFGYFESVILPYGPHHKIVDHLLVLTVTKPRYACDTVRSDLNSMGLE